MSLRRPEKVLVGVIVLCLAALDVIVAVRLSRDDGLHSTWGRSAEFSQLMTGQERFSVHSTNVPGAVVYVDHETGAQYLGTEVGVCPLLDADGTPLLVAEAG